MPELDAPPELPVAPELELFPELDEPPELDDGPELDPAPEELPLLADPDDVPELCPPASWVVSPPLLPHAANTTERAPTTMGCFITFLNIRTSRRVETRIGIASEARLPEWLTLDSAFSVQLPYPGCGSAIGAI